MLGYIVVSMASAGEFGVTDLITLWAGAKIAMDGGNPYDAATLDRVYDSLPMDVGRQNRFWYPPWSLSLLIFFALFPISVLVPLWMLVNLLFSVLSVVLIFKIFHGDTIVRRAEHPRAVLLTIAVFVISCSPLAVEIKLGQVTSIVLASLGAALFVLARRSTNMSVLAGVILSASLLKPHLLFLVYLLVVLQIHDNAYRGLLKGFIIGALLLTLFPLVIRFDIYELFRHAALPPFFNPTVGAWLWSLNPEHGFLRFLPAVVTAVVVSGYHLVRRIRVTSDILVGVALPLSLILTPYAWTYDYMLLIPTAILTLLRAAEIGSSRLFVGVSVALIGANLGIAFGPPEMQYSWWYPFVILFASVHTLGRWRAAAGFRKSTGVPFAPISR